ncbi:oxidation resistance protein 1 isoform X3 [Drosophila pseudoobscura]|uniref:Oxidation resistance protein 1 n=1 Tax=Drosophila pseudoobscura pseudoobscura TaxID=46245 RepID=A0A6I8WDS8_DROPS|nr:oxidation resistance protein 1 isoform X3 [Drosophila pseudoobscura]
MSIIDNGKYRLRKDWASASIPSLVNIDEHEGDAADESSLNITAPLPPQKPPRRSSLALGLFSGLKSDKSQKRRSSIAVSFLRRDSSKNSTKDSYESAVRSEKSDGSGTPTNSPEIPIYSSEENIRASSPNEPGKQTYFEDGSQTPRPVLQGLNSSYEAAPQRRRRSSLQTKLDRHRRKKMEYINQRSLDSTAGMTYSESHSDLTNDVSAGRQADDEDENENEDDDIIDPREHGEYFPREKRHSWWNIFVPDNFKNRSKSRSVDHGLAAPFDLDSLRSKVEQRFESVDKLSRQKSSLPTIPTISYTVGNRDTLTSVAARFDTTPSELTHLNRLNSSFIYPGQQLLVPDKSAKDDASSSSTNEGADGGSVSGKSSPIERKLSGDETRERDILEGLRPGSPKPGHIERVAGNSQAEEEANKSDDPVITQRFLKINVRHITDGQGVVGGVLLVTPNAVMFDPNVSDPLVIEHQAESYGVIAPMDLVVNAAIFHDIAHMRVVGGAGPSVAAGSCEAEKPEIYYPKPVLVEEDSKELSEQQPLMGDDADASKERLEAEIGSLEITDDQESLCSSTGRDGDAFPKAFERERIEDSSLEAKDSAKTDAEDEDKKTGLGLTDTRTTLEERRKSLLDHHWAIPSKDRYCLSNSRRSSEDEADNESNITVDSGARSQDPLSAASSVSGVPHSSINLGGAGAAPGAAAMAGSGGQLPGTGMMPPPSGIDLEHLEQLSKQSCYDSGIDIREPVPSVQPIPKKTVYSDADIVLSSDWVPPKNIVPTHFGESPPRSTILGQSLDAGAGAGGARKKTSSVSFSVDDEAAQQAQVQAQVAATLASDKQSEKKNKMLKRLSYPLTWVEGLTGEGGAVPAPGSGTGSLNKSADTDSAPNTGDSNQSVFSKVFSSSPITLVSELGGNLFSKTPSEDSGGSPVPPLTPHSTHSEGHMTYGRSSIGTFIRPHSSEGTSSSTKLKEAKQAPKLDYRSMVSMDDKPELFISVDKLIPRPARACLDPPLYLRLRMGKPIGKAIPLPTSVMSYGKNKLRAEYWFSVPKNRVDELYRFINTWVKHLYGELDEEQIKARGFELIQEDTEWTKSGTTKAGLGGGSQDGEEISDLTRESWELIKAPFAKTYKIIKTASHAASHDLEMLGGEVLSMSTDEYRKTSLFATGSFDLDFPIPDLIGKTEILTEEHREKLCSHLPARAEGYSWSLIFSTSQHGFALNSLYRKMARLESPVLIVIEDTDNNVFGALTSCSLHVSDHFYGTGESLLYKFNPSFKVFHWTGENMYFIKGNMESLSIGAGDGRFGLWLDGDLNQGRSQSCSTYGNEPLAPQEDFVIKTLECWAFV